MEWESPTLSFELSETGEEKPLFSDVGELTRGFSVIVVIVGLSLFSSDGLLIFPASPVFLREPERFRLRPADKILLEESLLLSEGSWELDWLVVFGFWSDSDEVCLSCEGFFNSLISAFRSSISSSRSSTR